MVKFIYILKIEIFYYSILFSRLIKSKRKDDTIKYLTLTLLIGILLSGCSMNLTDETHSLHGISSSWEADLQITFTEDPNERFIEGNLEFLDDTVPHKVNYYLSYPQGESSGISKGKNIKIASVGGTRDREIDDIEEFAEKVTLEVEWEDGSGEKFQESIPLD